MKADPERIHRTATRIAELADAFWDDVDALRHDAESLMESAWTGDAARTHAALWSEWVDSARLIAGALSEDAGLLHHAATEYGTTENTNANAVADCSLRLNF